MEEKWNKLFDKNVAYDKTLNILALEFQRAYDKNLPSPRHELEKEYERIKIIGNGSFGTVVLCKHKRNHKYLAIKILVKEAIIKNRQIKQVCQEKKCLVAVCFPFIIHLETSFKDTYHLYFGLPFINGGEMYTYHRKQHRFRENEAKFYAAQTFLAIEYLHSAEVLYRDLKPENILIDMKGYIKLTDFGFAKRIEGRRTYTLCGTPEYLAPEVILSQPYGKSVDWWAFGILIYEFVAGYLPFESKNQEDPIAMFEHICEGKYRIPSFFSSELHKLIQDLLQSDVSKRIGVLKNGSNDIKGHDWFKGTDWISLLCRETESFYTPDVKDAADTSQFDQISDTNFFSKKTPKIIDGFYEEFKDF